MPVGGASNPSVQINNVIICVGIYTGWLGWRGLHHAGPQQASAQTVQLLKS
jgi:hypothetical protein